MAFTFNGNTPEIVTFNGNDVLVIKWNGTTVWEKNTMPKCLAFVATSSGTFTFNGNDRGNKISYSIDSGTTWSTEAVNVSVDVNSGDIVLWKGELVNQGYYSGIGAFGGTATFEAQGNIMSLLYGDNFEGQTEFTSSEGGDFYGLFADTNIESAENLEIPITDLTEYCYQYMFSGCTLLETAPTLSAETLVDGCYDNMFNGCSILSYIKMLATDITATDCLNNWVADVAASGTFVKSADMTTLPIDSVNGIPIGWTVEDDAIDYSLQYLTMVATTDGTFGYRGNAQVSYSIDSGATWSTQSSSFSINVTTGSEVMLKSVYSGKVGSFSGGTAYFDLKGNVMSLLYGDDFIEQTVLKGSQCFLDLFKYSKVEDASNLVLPATTLTSSCYRGFFSNCSYLTKAPLILPATTLENDCYSWMFENCPLIETAPILPAATLTQYCYMYMFVHCQELNYVKMLATDISGYGCLTGWLSDVASSGTFVKNATMTTLPSGDNGIPSGWNVENATE